MAVNAFSQDSFPRQPEQEEVSLITLKADGSLNVHPALVQQYAPNLLAGLLGTPSPTLHREAAAPMLRNVGNVPGDAGQRSRAPDNKPNQYDLARKSNYKQGRIWASYVRRLIRTDGYTRYEAMQYVAQAHNRPVTDVRCLVELHNKARRLRAKTMRQNLVWWKHLEGMTDKQIAEALRIHSKTVASDRKNMKQQQLGGVRNVS